LEAIAGNYVLVILMKGVAKKKIQEQLYSRTKRVTGLLLEASLLGRMPNLLSDWITLTDGLRPFKKGTSAWLLE